MTNRINETQEFEPVDANTQAYSSQPYIPQEEDVVDMVDNRKKRIMNDMDYFTRANLAYHAPSVETFIGMSPYKFADRAYNEFVCGEPVFFANDYLENKDKVSPKEMDYRGLVYYDSEGNQTFVNPETDGFFSGDRVKGFIKGFIYFLFFIIAMSLIMMPLIVGNDPALMM